MNGVEHDIDFEHDVAIGKTKNPKALTGEIEAPSLVVADGCIDAMLIAIDLDDDPRIVTEEVRT